jgi:MFS family permease
LFNFICTFTFVSFHLAAAPYNLSASWLGAIFVVYIVGSVLTPWTGWAVGRFGRRHFMVGVIAVWLGGIALTLAPSLPLIIAGLALGAGCGLICQAVSTGYVTTTAKAGRSSAVGLYVTSFYTGGSFGAAVAAMLVIMAAIVMFAWTGTTRRETPSPIEPA